MSLKFKEPESLKFEFDNKDPNPLDEVDFLNKEQNTGIELEKLKGRKQDRKERKKYARHIFTFIWVWCIAILLIMMGVGYGIFKFDNSVIITLITTTTANILALFVIVANYLFFRPKK